MAQPPKACKDTKDNRRLQGPPDTPYNPSLPRELSTPMPPHGERATEPIVDLGGSKTPSVKSLETDNQETYGYVVEFQPSAVIYQLEQTPRRNTDF